MTNSGRTKVRNLTVAAGLCFLSWGGGIWYAESKMEQTRVVLSIQPPAEESPLRAFFDAIAQVESKSDDNAVGDGGKSIGRYQIGRLYWQDAGVPGAYEDVRDPAYAERVMLAYWSRWCPEALTNRDYETLSRVHNGGPRGAIKRTTLPYWSKVEKALEGTKP